MAESSAFKVTNCFDVIELCLRLPMKSNDAILNFESAIVIMVLEREKLNMFILRSILQPPVGYYSP